MTRLLLLLAMAGLLAGLPWLVDPSVSAGARGQSGAVPDGPAYRFEELADGVHFAIGTGAMTVFSNSLVIINDDHVMLVDTSVTPAAARELVGQIKAELTDKPIRYVFNSHYHFDHAHGNQIFGDDVEVIGHDYVRRMHLSNVLAQRTNRSFDAAVPAQIARLEQQVAAAEGPERAGLETDLRIARAHQAALRETVVTPPNVTYSDTMTIHKGGREVQLHFVGRGHTGGDTIVPASGPSASRSRATSWSGLRARPVSRTWATRSSTSGRRASAASRSWTSTSSFPATASRSASASRSICTSGICGTCGGQVADLRAEGVSAEDAAGRVDMSAYEAEYGSRVRNVDPRAVVRIYELLQIQMPL